VIITYLDEHHSDPHPDHIRTHVISTRFDAAGSRRVSRLGDAVAAVQALRTCRGSIGALKALHAGVISTAVKECIHVGSSVGSTRTAKDEFNDAHRLG